MTKYLYRVTDTAMFLQFIGDKGQICYFFPSYLMLSAAEEFVLFNKFKSVK